MNKKLISLFVAGIVLTLSTVASAGNKGGMFSVSPVIGGLTFEGGNNLDTSPLFGGRLGYNFTDSWGIEALFDYARPKFDDPVANTLHYYRYGGELLYHFMPEKKFVPYFAAGAAGMNFNNSAAGQTGGHTKEIFDYGLGAKYFVTEDIAWRVDVRHLFNNEHQELNYTVGLYIPFGGTSAIAKLADPPPAPVNPPKELAPLPPASPLAGLSATPASIARGEASTLNWVSQNTKNCDIQPGIGPVATKGSMPVTPGDTTQYTLNCTGDGGTAKGSASVEVRTAVPVVVAKPSKAAERFCNKPAILMINFDVDKHNIKPQYHNELKTVGDFLKEFPKSHGEISGHTDSTYTKAHNQKLSERRANSVKEYIIKNFGIAPERLTSKGYGMDKPIATNKTKEGRATNRRIEANFNCK
jgi:OOP family OmpA-OmpF porin